MAFSNIDIVGAEKMLEDVNLQPWHYIPLDDNWFFFSLDSMDFGISLGTPAVEQMLETAIFG
jgi:hypothetical protein